MGGWLKFTTKPVGMTRGAHGVLTKNKNSYKNFYSRPYNNLPQKIPCGRTTIFARGAHIRAKGRGAVSLSFGVQALACFFGLCSFTTEYRWPTRGLIQ
jgi:hypothetical protein